MAIRWISANWKTHLQTISPPTDRFYIDFRQKEYPHVAGTPTYTALTSGTQWSGYSNMTGGYAQYLLDMPTTLTLDIRAKANFAYDTGSDQPLASWYADANNYLTVYYDQTTDKIIAKWKGGTAERTLESEQYDAGAAFTNINTVERVTLVFDSTSGDTTGSELLVNGVSQDTSWSGNADARTVRAPTFEIRAENTTVGDWLVNTVRYFSGVTATSAEATDNFKSTLEEEVYWYLNSCALGRTRCNVTAKTLGSGCGRSTEDIQTGTLIANRLNLTLNSNSGEFADEQYAAWDPANRVYNGTTAQRYMTKRCPVIAETWYGDDFEPYFIGRVEGGFQRSTPIGGISTVRVDAVDQTAEVANVFVRQGQYWEDKKIADATEANSLVHLITRVGTQRTVYNYLANSSFENATIANSWTASAGTLTREATPLLGSNCGQMANATGGEVTVSQTVTMTGTKKLNVGETWTFSVYLKSAAAATAEIRIEEHDSGGINGSAATTTYNLSGGEGWVKYEVSRDIADSTSDRVAVYIEVADTKTVLFDCASLDQNDRAKDWFVLNDNDGASGVESADDADSDTYDTCGFDVDAVAYTHGWARVDKGENVWTYVRQLADAAGAYQCGFSEAGVFTFKCMLATGYSDPTAVETVDTATSVTAVLEPLQANKIVVRGVKILKDDAARVVWNAPATGLFTQAKGYPMFESVLNGNDFPDSTSYPEFVAAYDEEGDARAGVWVGGG